VSSYWQWINDGYLWNDFTNETYVPHCFALPTANGCVETTELEGFREGQYDLRYQATLEAAIAAAPSSQTRTAASSYLSWLKTASLDSLDLDTVRPRWSTISWPWRSGPAPRSTL